MDAIARTLGTTWETAKAALAFAGVGGVSPNNLLPTEPVLENGRSLPREVDAEVVRLRDEEGWSFLRIGAELGIRNATASRAYNRGRASKNAARHQRGRFRHLPKELFETVETLLAEGRSIAKVAAAAGCSENTVRRFKK